MNVTTRLTLTCIFVLLTASLLAASPVTPAARAAGNPNFEDTPARMSIPGHDFPLLPFPSDGILPYISGAAFWRFNFGTLEIASHCGETPGDWFESSLQLGSPVTIGRQTFHISKIIVVRYSQAGNPYGADWIADGVRYSPLDFSGYVQHLGAVVIHSSLCEQGIAFGQTVYIAK
jgi:hypothetical protein